MSAHSFFQPESVAIDKLVPGKGDLADKGTPRNIAEERHDFNAEDFGAIPVWQGAERMRIPAGEYTARCVNSQGPMWVRQFGRWGLRLEFLIDPDEYALSCFFALGENKRTPYIGARSKYYKAWVLANGGPPYKGQAMTPEVFLDPALSFTVRVGDSTKDTENNMKEDALIYSRIDTVLKAQRIDGTSGKQSAKLSIHQAIIPLSF